MGHPGDFPQSLGGWAGVLIAAKIPDQAWANLLASIERITSSALAR